MASIVVALFNRAQWIVSLITGTQRCMHGELCIPYQGNRDDERLSCIKYNAFHTPTFQVYHINHHNDALRVETDVMISTNAILWYLGRDNLQPNNWVNMSSGGGQHRILWRPGGGDGPSLWRRRDHHTLESSGSD